MDRRVFAASVLAAAVSIAGAATMTAAPASAAKPKLVACYGINAIGRNDCASGAHSCAGQATIARDPNSFVLLPAGDCEKIAGGSLKPAS